MAEKEKLVSVRFWVGVRLKTELNDFAHSLNLATADLYKAGAILMKRLLENPGDIVLNLFTRSFKDFENTQLKKKTLKAFKESRNVY